MSLTTSYTTQIIASEDFWADLHTWQEELFAQAVIEAKDARVRAFVAEVDNALRCQQGTMQLPEWAPWLDAMGSPEELMRAVWEGITAYSPYVPMCFSTPDGVWTVRSDEERDEGRWQATLYAVEVDPDWGVDDRDLALPGAHGALALSWRAPHQIPPARMRAELGTVFESEDCVIIYLRPEAVSYGLSLEEVEAYAQGAAGNY